MADGIKISALTEATDAQTVDGNLLETAVVDSSSSTGFSSKKTPISRLANYVLSKFTGLSLGGSARTVKTAIDALQTSVDKKADADGEYDNLVVGTADQLLSEAYTENFEPYKFRRSPYTDRLSESIIGASVAWNQLADENLETWYKFRVNVVSSGRTTTLTVTNSSSLKSVRIPVQTGHKLLLLASNVIVEAASAPYYGVYEGTSSAYNLRVNFQTGTALSSIINVADGLTDPRFTIGFNTSHVVDDKVTFTDLQLIDLTQMFGTTVADALYAMGDDGVALFRSWYPKADYEYSVPTLEHVSGIEAHEMVGFNQWDEVWELGAISNGSPVPSSSQIRSKNFCPVLPETVYYATCGKTDGGSANRYYLFIDYYDADKSWISSDAVNNLTFTTPTNAAYFKIHTNSGTVVYGTTYNNDICINISDPTRNGQYKPYSKHSYALDASLTLRGILKYDSSKGIYADGDIYKADGTVTRKYGIVDLGTLNWQSKAFGSNSGFFSIGFDGVAVTGYDGKANAICQRYQVVTNGTLSDASANKVMAVGSYWQSGCNIYVVDSAYSDAASFKAAMSETYLVYEKSTVTTESAEPYEAIQITDGTEEYVTDCLAPVGHESKYYENLRSKIEGLPTDFSAIICATEPTSKASRNYAVGDYLIYENTLYKVITAIATDATLTVGTNITATTIMAEIKALQ